VEFGFKENFVSNWNRRAHTDMVAHLHDVTTMLEAERARNRWQPIDTAPQDGTRVLLWAEGKCRVGNWIYYPADANNPVAPTHWMPLPEPPSADALVVLS
jgi:hypothetical protein